MRKLNGALSASGAWIKGGLAACVEGTGAGGLAGHTVNPSLEARGRHPWRPTVPPTHPHRHLDANGPVVEIKKGSATRQQPSWIPTPLHPTPHHHPSNKTPDQNPSSDTTRHDESKRKQSQPLIFVAYRYSTEALAWVGLRGPPAHGCAGGAYKGEGALLARHRLACVRTHSRQRLGRAAERDLRRVP